MRLNSVLSTGINFDMSSQSKLKKKKKIGN